ncbi:hypothetical protein D3C76_1272800 [compost metagenome]
MQTEGLVGEIQPLILLAQTQGATAGIDHNGAFRTTGGQVQIDVGIEQALPGEVLGQPLRQALQRELLEVITQTRLGSQTLVVAAQAGLSGAPAMGAEIQLPSGQAL